MSDSKYPRAELAVKIVAPLLTVVGILVGVWQFQDEQRKNTEREYALIAKQDSIEFKRRLWQEQLDTYRRVATVAGSIATTSENRERFNEAVREFDSLYWGMMAFVQDAAVEQKMIDLRTEILDYRNGMSSPDRLKVRADMLIEATRASLRSSWGELRTGG